MQKIITISEFKTLIEDIKPQNSIEADIQGNFLDYIHDTEDDEPNEVSDLITNLIDETHTDGYAADNPQLIRSECTYPFTNSELENFIQTYLPWYYNH